MANSKRKKSYKKKKSNYMVVLIPQKGSRRKKRTAKFGSTEPVIKGGMKSLKAKKLTKVVFKLNKKTNKFKKVSSFNTTYKKRR